MIWLTWRQYRMEALISGGLLAALGLLLVTTGIDMANAFQSAGVGHCLTPQSEGVTCGVIIDSFTRRFGALAGMTGWLNFLPLGLAVLLAAPFVIELEHGTYRLAWTQSITRTRWLTIRLLVIGAAAIAASLVFTLMMTWWRGPWDQLDGRLQPNNAFDFEGLMPTAYLLFAVALILLLGTLLRRTVPALGIAAVVYVVTRLSVQSFVRPNFLAPLADRGGGSPAFSRLDWQLGGGGFMDRHGHALSDDFVLNLCASKPGGPTAAQRQPKDAFINCLHSHGISQFTTFQPANRFWTFQAMEATLYLGLIALLIGVTVWWVRRRLT